MHIFFFAIKLCIVLSALTITLGSIIITVVSDQLASESRATGSQLFHRWFPLHHITSITGHTLKPFLCISCHILFPLCRMQPCDCTCMSLNHAHERHRGESAQHSTPCICTNLFSYRHPSNLYIASTDTAAVLQQRYEAMSSSSCANSPSHVSYCDEASYDSP